MFRSARDIAEIKALEGKVKSLEKQLEGRNQYIEELHILNRNLRIQLDNQKPTVKDVKNCVRMVIPNNVVKRYIYCRDGLYTVSRDERYPNRTPDFYVDYAKELGVEKNPLDDCYYVDAKAMHKYLTEQGYTVDTSTNE